MIQIKKGFPRRSPRKHMSDTKEIMPQQTLQEHTISIFTELPESLWNRLAQYLEFHVEMGQDDAIAAALELFLSQEVR